MAADSDPGRLDAELADILRRARQITDEHGPDDCDLNGETCTGHDAERLLAAVERVLKLAAQHEHGATRWADPLPVPSWIPHLREAIESGLDGKEEPEWLTTPWPRS